MLDGAALGPAVARAAARRVRAALRRARRRAARERRLERHRRPAPGAARGRASRDGDEVITSPFSFVASANVDRLRARAAGVRRHRPAHADDRPGGRGRRGQRAHARRCCRCTSSASRPTCRRSSGSGCRSSRTPARRSARASPTACRSARAATRRCSRFYANKQMTTGEGGMVTLADAGAQGAHRQRAQPGPRAGHGLARPRPPRLQLPPDRARRARSASRSSTASTRCSPARARGRASLRRGARRDRGARAAVPRRRRRACAAGSSTSSSCRAASTATASCGRCASAACQSKPYLPAIHLMSYYRETFGHRQGEFPVCEDIAARSLALPFFPELSEGQVARVAAALADVLGSGAPRLDCAARCRASPSRSTPTSRRSTPRWRSTGGCGPTTSRSRARTRAMLAAIGVIGERRARRSCCAGARRGRGGARGRAASRSAPTTRTSTWRSSGG